jgi:Na+-driven multidrug efflux pump
VSVFSAEGELMAVTSDFVRIAAVSYLLMGLMAVFSQCVAAAGDTMRPMLIGFVSIWLIQLPLSYVLAHFTSLGVYGIRWGMVAGIAVSAAFYIIYFQSGKWRNRRIAGLS